MRSVTQNGCEALLGVLSNRAPEEKRPHSAVKRAYVDNSNEQLGNWNVQRNH